MFKILGIDDSVNACECCGKSNLKSTVVVEVNGEVLHYGSVCATRHTGMKAGEINTAARAAYDARKTAARVEYVRSAEHLAHEAKLSQARRLGIASGRAFKEFHAVEQIAAQTKRAEIAARYGVQAYEIH